MVFTIPYLFGDSMDLIMVFFFLLFFSAGFIIGYKKGYDYASSKTK